MTNVWGATSTTDDVLSGIDLHGKRILVTGVSAGIGVETARALAAHGAHVTGAARDLEKAEAATAQVRQDAASNGGSFGLVALDLASLKSVRACADGLLDKKDFVVRGQDQRAVVKDLDLALAFRFLTCTLSSNDAVCLAKAVPSQYNA